MSSFRPQDKLPYDPFSNIYKPFIVASDYVQSIAGSQSRNQVVVVLGEVSFHDISPFLSPPTSLLLLATHSPPKFPSSFTNSCSIRILRVLSPLEIHNSGALRLVSLFERAQLVVQIWRESGQQISLVQLAESESGSEFNVLESFASNPASSISPPVQMPNSESNPSPASSLILNLSSSHRKRPSRLIKSPVRRTFDAVVNFIPSSLPEKSMFKAAVLVTTLSHQFLATPTAKRSTTPALSKEKNVPTRAGRLHSLMFKSTGSDKFVQQLLHVRHWSVWSQSSKPPVLSLDTQAAQVSHSDYGRAHLIHVLPDIYAAPISVRRGKAPLKPRLVQKIEQFLLNFSYQLSHICPPETPSLSRPASFASISSWSSVSSRSSTHSSLQVALTLPVDDGEMERPVPYLLSTKLLAHVPKVRDQRLSGEGHVNIAGLILHGALDPGSNATKAGTSEDNIFRHSTLLDGLMVDVDMPRVWISSTGDIRISAGNQTTSSDGYFSDVSLYQMQPAAPSSRPVLVVDQLSATPIGGLPVLPKSFASSESSSLSRDIDEDYVSERKRVTSAPTVPRIASKSIVPAPLLPTGPSRTLGRKTLLTRLKFWKIAS